MAYREALIYDNEGSFRGYGILSPTGKLKSTNIWTEEDSTDLRAQIDRLNTDVALREHWPSLGDPEVRRLLQDPEFEQVDPRLSENERATAVQLRTRKAFELVARKRAAIEG